MRFNILALSAVAGVAALASMAVSPASAAIQAGTLTCNIAGGVGAVIASQKAVSCTFKPAFAAPVELYTGTFTRIGLDLSAVNAGVLTYNVISAANALTPFSLAGTYTGPGVGLTIGSGIGVDAIVGGNGNLISLQPIAVSTSTGLGINAGLGTLVLTPAGTAPRHFRHHRHHRFHHVYR